MSEQDRRRQIIEDVRPVFVAVGYDGSRTRELAAAAGITEATLFTHFPSKAELFEEAVMEPLRAAMIEGLGPRSIEFSAMTGRQERFDFIVRGVARFLGSMNQVYPLLVTALFSSQGRGENFYNTRILPVLQTESDAARRALPEGLQKDVQAETVTLMMLGTALALNMDASFRQVEPDWSDLSRQIAYLLLNGLNPSGNEPPQGA